MRKSCPIRTWVFSFPSAKILYSNEQYTDEYNLNMSWKTWSKKETLHLLKVLGQGSFGKVPTLALTLPHPYFILSRVTSPALLSVLLYLCFFPSPGSHYFFDGGKIGGTWGGIETPRLPFHIAGCRELPRPKIISYVVGNFFSFEFQEWTWWKRRA